MKRGAHEKYIVPVVSKALDVLEAFHSPEEQLNLNDVIQRTGASHATAFRVLYTLVHRGYVARHGTKYQLTKIRQKTKIGYAALSSDVAISMAIAQSLRKAAGPASMDLVLLNNEESARIAVENARRLVAERVSVAIEFQNNSEVAPVIADLFATAGIPAIAIHIAQPGAVYFGPDNYRAGWTAGQALAEHALRKWAGRFDLLLLLDVPRGGPTLQSRMTGVIGGLEHALGAVPPEWVLRLDAGGTRNQTRQMVASVLRRHPKRRVLISAVSDEGALAALHAVRAARREAATAIVGHDGSEEALRAIAQPGSPLIGTVAFFPDQYGPRLIDLATRLLKNEAVPPFVYVTHQLITRSNLTSAAIRNSS